MLAVVAVVAVVVAVVAVVVVAGCDRILYAPGQDRS